jgi:hypothetical protein
MHEHDAELRAGHVEPVVLQLQRVRVHHATFHMPQPFAVGARQEPLDHRRRPVRRHRGGSQPGGRQAQPSWAGRDIEEGLLGGQSGEAEGGRGDLLLPRRDELVVRRGDRVPGLRRCGLVMGGGGCVVLGRHGGLLVVLGWSPMQVSRR